MKLPVLPAYYYHDHFGEMLRHVVACYGSVLTADHIAFIDDFKRLSKDAQCLLIRMVNRKGRIFRHTAFRYAEIADCAGALSELMQRGYVRALGEGDYAAFAKCVSKEALCKAAEDHVDVRKSWSKAKLVAFVLGNIPFAVSYETCAGRDFVALGETESIEFLLFLYFGKTEDSLKSFALRDLGILRTNEGVQPSARFTDGEEASACFYYGKLLDQLDAGDEPHYHSAFDALRRGPDAGTDYVLDLRSRAAHRVGLYFERAGEQDTALQLYRMGSSPECNERLARLLYASGDKAGAEALLRRMIDDPGSDEEFIFASDYYARKFNGRRTAACTELLRSAQSITVDDTWRGNPEAGVAGVLRRGGASVFYAENTLWQCLFGLVFWDELFESGQLHSSFNWLPHCLKDRSFARRFASEIKVKLEKVAASTAQTLILKTIAARWGKPNGVFAWECVNVDALSALLRGADPAGIADILRLMCEDYRAMRDGFPDLMLVDNGAISFLEVKAEGDVIRRNQLTRLRQLGNAGIAAHIGLVDFRFDPAQDYVVVDIETTGGWAGGDRITEIGAVKIRNHAVVAEWHSLINPQRSIPAKITQLTGITNAMVRDAPLFGDVADSFINFMDDGIFVAHSVNFDYGFIAHEYERIGRRFRFPKLCTCASMRRRYPGHKSYGLANLCDAYAIDLTDHHRALADARAAAQLLNLINRQREAAIARDDLAA
ncbi:DNA polymerase III PolC-type [Variibacter gotjawalensis]|uniref:DNA polymerase III PolC-type n=1 Tax=Variibacter gotjawalensis TaxID=1333996 RepID=A0A0S3PU79_9BRAD|nr:exonuclease domain-containing protein [Variibacter gotjawalensis]NIK49818.1 DNA polymerase-3 subunit epsilon [Variibacter gotjawalensis]RZS45820.1 DNA polymerase-3 subunit epsilon [Variibacter gotjawalensis]BAT59495.1 DNA polymerase III PolC-type [Variibacter gotjawalensis]